MKYMGSKNRLAKHLLPIILKNRKPEQWYVEPFVGGANMIDKVEGNRIGADSNEYLIALPKEMQLKSFNPPEVSEQLYNDVKSNKDNYPDWLVGYVGFQLSYGAMWFGSYRRDKAGIRDYSSEAIRNLTKQINNIVDVDFINCDYDDISMPSDSIIYCDPPYQNTVGYKANKEAFNHDKFWEWCRDQAKAGHEVFISEYNAPDDFICVFEREQVSSLTKNTGSKKGIECLFVHNSQHELSNAKGSLFCESETKK